MRISVKKSIASMIWLSGLGSMVRIIAAPRAVIVAYHSIGRSNKSYKHINISLQMFVKHIQYLRHVGYTFLQFKDIKRVMKVAGNKRYVCIYFDDGFKDIYKNVYPILKENNILSTMFVATDYIDQKNGGSYLSWDELEKMKDVFEYGSHSVSHIKLNKIPVSLARREFELSKNIIESKLNVPVTSFSYPKGRFSTELESEVHKAGYNITTADPVFHKVRPDPGDNLSIFKCKLMNLW